MSIKCSNMDFLFVSLCFENNLLVFSVAMLDSFRIHCWFCIWYFHRLWHRNKLVNQFVMSHRIVSFAYDEIFVFF